VEVFLPVLIVGGISAFVVAILVVGYFQEKKRNEGLAAVAEKLGLPFFPSGDPALIDELSKFELFTQGRSRKISNMLHGETDEVRVGIFDYQYTTGSGKNSHTWWQTVIYFCSPELNLPHFAMRPEHLFHKIGGLLGYEDLDFESHPIFSRKYLLRGSDPDRIRVLFRDEILTYFEDQKGVSVEGNGNQIIYYRASKRVAPDEVRGLMEEGFAVFKLFRS
jgi:hypothetical protein